MTPEVVEAIDQLKAEFGLDNVTFIPDEQGGACVFVNNIDVGMKYLPSKIWCGFPINYTYPQGDVYPHFINEELKRTDGQPFSNPISGPVDWPLGKKRGYQISRKSNRLNPLTDTALTKLLKVIHWLKEL